MKATLALVPPDQRSAVEAQAKQMITMFRSPEAVQVQRAELEEARRGSKENFESQLERWRTNYPADPQVLIARRLREFLATSATVDFNAVVVAKDNHMVFANPEYERKPAEWKSYYRYGRESIAAAREVAAAWLKEIGQK